MVSTGLFEMTLDVFKLRSLSKDTKERLLFCCIGKCGILPPIAPTLSNMPKLLPVSKIKTSLVRKMYFKNFFNMANFDLNEVLGSTKDRRSYEYLIGQRWHFISVWEKIEYSITGVQTMG